MSPYSGRTQVSMMAVHRVDTTNVLFANQADHEFPWESAASADLDTVALDRLPNP